MKKVIILLTAVISLLNSCSLLGGEQMQYTDEQIIDKRINEILEALETQDKVRIKLMFSETALADSIDFDDHLNYLLDFFQGDVLLCERKGGPFVFEGQDNGHRTKQISSWYKVDTDKQNYLFIFIEWLKDTEEPKNVGLYTLRVILAEDEETQFSSWDGVEIPGIYKPE